MKIGFIGTGNMGTAIIKGYLSAHKDEKIYAYDKDQEKLAKLAKEIGIVSIESIENLVLQCDMIVIAVKPGIYEMVIPEIKNAYKTDKIIVSIAAGISIGYMEKLIGIKGVKIVRVMPNTPAMVNEGMSALCKNEFISDEEFKPALELFKAVGKVEMVDEKLIDAVIGVSGSSPAYVYMFIEALIDGAVKSGMPEEQAKVFAAQSVLGGAKMVLETGINPVTLRENVCSPGGTTIEAVKTLQNNGFHENIIRAMNAAIEKSKIMTK